MKNIIKTSWRDVTINEYFDFRDKLESASSDYEKEIIKIAFVNGFKEDDVWNMTISDVKRYQQNTLWLNDFEISKDVKFKNIKIEGSVDTSKIGTYILKYIIKDKNGNEEILIPAVKSFVIDIDINKKQITVLGDMLQEVAVYED